MQPKELIVTKAGGDSVPFSVEKLRTSMRNAGAEPSVIDQVIEVLNPRLYDGISTKKIYRWAFELLKQRSKYVAAKYQLKKAIMELGPDGFVFEKFIARIFMEKGYSVETGKILQGRCITHEIDVLARNTQEVILGECKYHSQPGKISDVKVPLYIRSRFVDLSEHWKKEDGRQLSSWIITNTRFSPDAMKYGKCIGQHLLGWDYPKGQGIKELIDERRLYPITCLTVLTRTEKEELLKKEIIFCEDLYRNQGVLESLRLSITRQKNIMDELEKLRSGN